MGSNYSKQIVEVTTIYKTINGKSMKDQTVTTERLGRGITQTTTRMRDYNATGTKMNVVNRKITRGFQRFQMEQLGVMFAGMALNRAMANVNSTSREWLGIGDLMSTMLGVTLLDSNLALLEKGVLPLFNALTNLPEGAKKAIGFTAFALEGLGGAMMVGGQLMLGLDSTATLLSKIAGVQPSLIFTETGLTALKSKLGGSLDKMKKLGKIAGAGIAMKMAIDDLEEGDLTAAVGSATLGVGIATGNPYLIGIGVTLKLVGEPEFLAKFLVFGLKIIDNALALGEDIGTAIWSGITGKEAEFKFLEGFGESALKEIAGAKFKSDIFQRLYTIPETAEGEISSPLGPIFGGNSTAINEASIKDLLNQTANNVSNVINISVPVSDLREEVVQIVNNSVAETTRSEGLG